MTKKNVKREEADPRTLSNELLKGKCFVILTLLRSGVIYSGGVVRKRYQGH